MVTALEVGHEVMHARHVEVFFLGLLVAITQLGRAIESESRPAISCEQAHLFTWKQCVAVNQITERQRTGAASDTNMRDNSPSLARG